MIKENRDFKMTERRFLEMKFNFRKITPIIASAVLLGSTIGFATVAADLAAYPNPFVASGAADVAIVYGVDGQAKDMEAAGLFSGDLASELADQTAGSASISTTLSGESVNLATSNTKLYYLNEIDSAKQTITDNELPNLLADGILKDDSGIEYRYEQSIKLASTGGIARNVTFGKSGEAIDPVVMVNIGTDVGSYPLWNYTVTFKKNVNTSHADVQGNTIKLLGTDYTVGSSSDTDTLILFGGGITVSVDEGDEKTVTLEEVDHTISLKGTTSDTAGVMIFDGITKSITEGNSYKFAGEVEVYVKELFHQSKTGTISSGDFLIGSSKITVQNKETVKKGADDTSIIYTKGTINGIDTKNQQLISGFSMAQTAASSIGDYLAEGDSYVDRVFGNIKLEFASLDPALDSETRDEVIIDTDNSANAKVTFTSISSGKPYTLYFGHDTDNIGSNTVVTVKLADSSNNTIHIIENASINLNEYSIVNDNDDGRIVRLIAVGDGKSSTSKTKFEDVITGEVFEFATGMTNQSAGTMGGGTYYYVMVNTPDISDDTSGRTMGNVTINWGTNSTYNVPGGVAGAAAHTDSDSGSVRGSTVVFPRIKLANGGWLALLTEVVLNNQTIVALPGNEVLSTYQAGALIGSLGQNVTDRSMGGFGTGVMQKGIKVGNLNYSTLNLSVDTNGGGNINVSIFGLVADTNSTPITSTGFCNFTTPFTLTSTQPGTDSSTRLLSGDWNDNLITGSSGPAILLIEEHKLGETNGDAVCVPLTTAGTTTVHVAIGTPVNTDMADMNGWTMETLTSNSYKSQVIDIYGTFVERDTSQGTDYKVTIKYPDDQMTADLFLAEIAAESTVSETSAGITRLGDVLLTDVEAETSKPADNLIVVGDSCVNRVALKLVSDEAYATYAFCGEKLTELYGYGENQAIVKLFESPYSADKKAMLIAGWEADDTIAAAKQVLNKKTTLADLDEKIITKGVDYT